jgi:putative membrane protein
MRPNFILRVSIAGFLMCAAAGGAWAQGKQATSGKPNKAAQTFVTKAVQGNLAEVSMGQLAQQKGNSDGVRSFGQQLVTDHSAANQKLTSVASGIGVTPPTEPSKKQKSDHDKMARMSGDAFDRAFARHMVADHRMAIADYRKAAKMKDDQIASYATETLPTLEKHLQMAQSLNKSGGKASGKPSM